MGKQDARSDGDDPVEVRPEEVFEAESGDPYELQRSVHQFLSQETPHNIVQVILGHPEHLVSVGEFDHYLRTNGPNIEDKLKSLASKEIVAKYEHPPNEDIRDHPSNFWGLTNFGVSLLEEYNYLRGLPIMRAVHDATQKNDTASRHADADRPVLPTAVSERLEYPKPTGNVTTESEEVAAVRDESFYTDAAPADLQALNDEDGGDSTLDELF